MGKLIVFFIMILKIFYLFNYSEVFGRINDLNSLNDSNNYKQQLKIINPDTVYYYQDTVDTFKLANRSDSLVTTNLILLNFVKSPINEEEAKKIWDMYSEKISPHLYMKKKNVYCPSNATVTVQWDKFPFKHSNSIKIDKANRSQILRLYTELGLVNDKPLHTFMLVPSDISKENMRKLRKTYNSLDSIERARAREDSLKKLRDSLRQDSIKEEREDFFRKERRKRILRKVLLYGLVGVGIIIILIVFKIYRRKQKE